MIRIPLCILFYLCFWPLLATAGEHRHIHAEWEHAGSESTLAGFRIYHQDKIVCETYEPTARSLDCEVLISSYPASFTVTAYDRNGNESVHSEPYLLLQATGNVQPEAVIAADPPSGAAPHTVTFDGSSSHDPDGRIVEYAWNFGDGQAGSGPLLTHTFLAAGQYTVTLAVTDDGNATAQAQTTIKVAASAAKAGSIPPVAKIAVTPQEGQAPLLARFDALDSSAPGGELASYAWDFGDGAGGSGETVNHIYTSSGSYKVKLTVTDSYGTGAQDETIITVRENTSTAAGFAFNFQPADVPVPEGYVLDSGSAFNQITGFGWSSSPGELGTRQRSNSLSPDQTYDSFIHVDPGGVWELALPNGNYLVTICAGDPASSEGFQHVRAEGVPLLAGLLSDTERWLKREAVVAVVDEHLTLTFEDSSPHTKLAWLRVEHPSAWKPALDSPENGAAGIPVPVQFKWSPPPAGAQLAMGTVTYTLYYGTDPRLEPGPATAPADSSKLLAGAFLIGGLGLAGRRRPRALLTALAMAAAIPALSSCGGGDEFPLLTGKVADTQVVERLNSNAFLADDLRSGETYYWKVIASDGEKEVESTISRFTTE